MISPMTIEQFGRALIAAGDLCPLSRALGQLYGYPVPTMHRWVASFWATGQAGAASRRYDNPSGWWTEKVVEEFDAVKTAVGTSAHGDPAIEALRRLGFSASTAVRNAFLLPEVWGGPLYFSETPLYCLPEVQTASLRLWSAQPRSKSDRSKVPQQEYVIRAAIGHVMATFAAERFGVREAFDTLCKWSAHSVGSYQPGQELDSHKANLQPCLKRSQTGRDLLAALKGY